MSPRYLVASLVVFLVFAVVAISGGAIWLTVQKSETAPETSMVPTRSRPTPEGLVSVTPDASPRGSCVPRYVIESFLGESEGPDLYGACSSKSTPQSCRQVDIFSSDRGAAGSDGHPDCEWKPAPLAKDTLSDYCSLIRGASFRSYSAEDFYWYINLQNGKFSQGQSDPFPLLPGGPGPPLEGSYTCDQDVLQLTVFGSNLPPDTYVYDPDRDALIRKAALESIRRRGLQSHDIYERYE
jgi:uncharacterized membrane protein